MLITVVMGLLYMTAEPLLRFMHLAAFGPPGDLLIVTRRRRAQVDAVEEIACLLGHDNVRRMYSEAIFFFGRRVLLCDDDDRMRLRGMNLAGVLIAADARPEPRFATELRRALRPGAPTFRS